MRDMMVAPAYAHAYVFLETAGGMNSKDPGAMGRVFDAAQVDDSFYLPPAALTTRLSSGVLRMFLSPDGKAARFIIDPRGRSRDARGHLPVEPIQQAAREAIKGTPLQGAAISMGGTASTYKDLQRAPSTTC